MSGLFIRKMKFLQKLNRILLFHLFFILLNLTPYVLHAKTQQKNIVSDIFDIKDFKKLLRTKNNVLTLFLNSPKQSGNVVKVFEETAEYIKGQGTMVVIDCSTEAKKLCKKLKVYPESYLLKHYKDGEFHKDYDRKYTVPSMLNFMRDPSGDVPWEEDSTTNAILHITDSSHLIRFLRKESGPVMVMFYAPWCGFCKQLKPEYAAAAEELKGHAILAAIDVNKPENSIVRSKYNITGFPTLIYFENGVKMFNYEGENNKASLIAFMKNPTAAPIKPVEVEWAESENEVEHLTDTTFEDIIKEAESILVMFYAPWCGHCKRLKPDYEKAAEKLKKNNVKGVLAALDATKETKTAKKFNVNGYPTLKYFKNGEFQFDVNLREEKELINFMKEPKKPPPPPPPEKPWADEESEVEHLTVENFKPFLKKKKNALVMFYAPWCGHCKKAKPEFTAAAEFFKDDSKVSFAAVDCTTHQSVCSAHQIKGYPTIKLFHYLNKEPIEDYNGGRTKQDFVSFMKSISIQNHSQFSEVSNERKKSDEKSGQSNEMEEGDDEYEADDWSEFENSDLILHLTDDNFNKAIQDHDFLFVFFYKTGCEKCREIKKEYSLAALMAENGKLTGKLAAYRASENKKIVLEKEVTSYPFFQLYMKRKFHGVYSGKFKARDFFNYLKNSQMKSKDEL